MCAILDCKRPSFRFLEQRISMALNIVSSMLALNMTTHVSQLFSHFQQVSHLYSQLAYMTAVMIA